MKSPQIRVCARSILAGRAMAEPLLALNEVCAGYGGSIVLEGISLELPERGSLAVLGRNGVGKSTLLLTIMGYTNVTHGTVHWRGEEITASLPPAPLNVSGPETISARALASDGFRRSERFFLR